MDDNKTPDRPFNHYGPDETPERVEFYNRKNLLDKQFMKEQLNRQMKEKDSHRKQ